MKVLYAVLATALFTITIQAQVPTTGAQSKNSAQPAATQESAAQKYFTDVELVNQNGQKMRFYSDLLKGHTVAIIPFFSTCTSVCPPMNATMRKVQTELGERVGKEVYLISITVDPETDTPERLKAYAEKFHAETGWYFLTGSKENVSFALKKIGQFVADKNEHQSIMIIGNEATGLWKKAFALAPASQLVTLIQGVADDKPKAYQGEN